MIYIVLSSTKYICNLYSSYVYYIYILVLYLSHNMYMVLLPQVCRNHRSAHKSVEFTTPALTFQYSILIIFQIRNKMKSVFKTYSPCFKPIALVNYLTRLDCSRTSTAIYYNSNAPSSAVAHCLRGGR